MLVSREEVTPDQNQDYLATERLVAWAYASRPALRTLADDPVWQWYRAIRAPKIESLRIVFEETKAPSVCAPCGHCCTVDARFVVRTYDVLGWALLDHPRLAPLAPAETSCLFLSPAGCLVSRDARPTICSTFTCSTLDEAIGTTVVNSERTVLWAYSQAVARYLSRTYSLTSSTHRASLGLSAADLHQLFDAGGEVKLSHVRDIDPTLQALRPIARSSPRALTMAVLDQAPLPTHEDDATSYLGAENLRRDHARLRAQALTDRPLPKLASAAKFSEVLQMTRTSHAELVAAEREYASRYCVACPDSGLAPPLPGDSGYEVRRQQRFASAAMNGRYKVRCMYSHCGSPAHLNALDVAAWKGLGGLPVFNSKSIGTCPALAEGGCSLDASARSPSCERFACHRMAELKSSPVLVDRINRLSTHTEALFELVRSAYGAHDASLTYPAAPSRGEPMFD